MKIARLLPPLLVVIGVGLLTAIASSTAIRTEQPAIPAAIVDEIAATATGIDEQMESRWRELGVTPAAPADDLQVLRRLSLALHGTIPSLEEIRRFESDHEPDRLARWTAAMLEDPRFADYFAERLARAFVGVEQGQFVIYRRDRFTDWLRTQLREGRAYDAIVRDMVSSRGVWTGKGEVNFIAAGFANGDFDKNKLAARTVRAFLGQRIDCAQCHDHPFDEWKQEQFEGLAAHFGQVQLTIGGIADNSGEYSVEDRETLERRTVEPSVPFHPEWRGGKGTQRERLAAWVTHPENRRFERAVVNRVWALLFGRPFLVDRPVDDLPDPERQEFADETRILDTLGRDFREHDCDLRRLIQIITATRAFRMDSIAATSDPQQLEQFEAAWAVFPITRRRPEQVIGAMLQANSVKTIDRNSHLFVRFRRFIRERDFVDEYGDLGESELDNRTGTISQALLRMNGAFAHEMAAETVFSAPGRIAGYSSTPEILLENCFLACLTRRPTPDEAAHFLPQLQNRRGQPKGVVQDIYWSLFNSSEF